MLFPSVGDYMLENTKEIIFFNCVANFWLKS